MKTDHLQNLVYSEFNADEQHTCFKKTCSCGCESGSTVTSKRGIKILSSMFWNDVTIPISL